VTDQLSLNGVNSPEDERRARHHCHARGCEKPVPPEMLMCRGHWFSLPKNLRDAVWRTYREGQCDDMRPSREWHAAADAAIEYVFNRERRPMSENKLKVIREQDIGDCQRCVLHTTRTNIVFGEGAANAALMFVGEGPGEKEDESGRPFVGAAGELLDKMIAAMGFERSEIYIANVVKCRPPGNRTPEFDEQDACLGFLRSQIDVIGPRVIVTLGRTAAQAMLSVESTMSYLRGKWHDLEFTKILRRPVRIMPTWHPSYLLRVPEAKVDTMADLIAVVKQLHKFGVGPTRPAALNR
jgi:DNA polymerase